MEMNTAEHFNKLVLRKLKELLMNGSLLNEDVLVYPFGWKEKSSRETNIHNAEQERNVLLRLRIAKVIDAEIVRNEYRHQQLTQREWYRRNKDSLEKQLSSEKATSTNNSPYVWAPDTWDALAPAQREYEHCVEIYSIDYDRFMKEIEKYGLKDRGTDLIEITPSPLVIPVVGKMGEFTAHKDGSIRYKSVPVTNLKPQEERLVHALLTKRGLRLTRTEISGEIWSEEHDATAFIDEPKNEPKIPKQISNTVSAANRALKGYDDKKHIELDGKTSYKFII